MSSCAIHSLMIKYLISGLTPFALGCLLVILACAIWITLGCVVRDKIKDYHLTKIHPNALVYNSVEQGICVGFVALVAFALLLVYIPNGWNKPDYNTSRIMYENQAIHYQRVIPKQKNEIHNHYNVFQANLIQKRNQKLHHKIEFEQNFVHKYRNMKGMHKPTAKNYFYQVHYMKHLNYEKPIKK